MMDKLEEIKQFLLKERNTENANLVETAEKEDGYFDAQDYSGGNFDDAFWLGHNVGEAVLIEKLLALL